MRWALLLGLFLPAGSLYGRSQVDPATAQVQQADYQLQQAERAKQYAEYQKNQAAQAAMTAKERAQWRRRAKEALEQAKANLQAAEANVESKKQKETQSAVNYIQAEDQYAAKNGGYYNPVQYEEVRARLGYESAAAPVDAAGATPESVQAETASMAAALNDGKAPSMGEIAARAERLSKMGNGVVHNVLETDYGGSGGAANRGGALSAGGGDASAGAAPRPSGSTGGASSEAALRSGTAVLLRAAGSDSGKAAAGRFVLAGKDRLQAGDPEGALRAADEALKANPSDAKALALKARALNKLHRYDEAEAAAQKAVDLDPGNAEAAKALVWAQLNQGKAEEAQRNATALIRLDPEGADGYLMRAFASELLGQRGRMLSDLERAAQLDPKYANHLARARAGQPLFDPSVRDHDGLLEALPELPLPAGRKLGMGLGLLLLLVSGGLYAFRAKAAALIEAAARRRGATSRTVGVRKPGEESAAPVLDAPAPAQEDLLVGKYRLQGVAGRGGMGRVWKAFDVSLARTVAVKEMSPELAHKPAVRELYLKEARALAALRHPNVVEIFEVVERPDQVYLILEWVEGKTLQQVFAEKGRLPLATLVAVLGPVCEALAFAHGQGIVHRDLKPGNIMVSADGSVKLMDFGIARALGRAAPEAGEPEQAQGKAMTMARTRSLAGTPAYRAPEAAQGMVAPAFDTYSLGVCLYELLTGRLPFGREGWSRESAPFTPPSQLVAGLPEAVDDLVSRMLDLDPARRPADMRLVKRALLVV